MVKKEAIKFTLNFSTIIYFKNHANNLLSKIKDIDLFFKEISLLKRSLKLPHRGLINTKLVVQLCVFLSIAIVTKVIFFIEIHMLENTLSLKLKCVTILNIKQHKLHNIYMYLCWFTYLLKKAVLKPKVK